MPRTRLESDDLPLSMAENRHQRTLSVLHDLPHGGGSEKKGREKGSVSYIVVEARSEKISPSRFAS